MTRQYFKSAISFTCILFISAGLAKADITRYVDADGVTTYTNLPHESGDDKVQTSLQNSVPEVGILSADLRSKSDEWASKRPNLRSVPLDVETIKAARAAMLVLDQTSHAALHKEFIVYDQRNRSWFDFR